VNFSIGLRDLLINERQINRKINLIFQQKAVLEKDHGIFWNIL